MEKILEQTVQVFLIFLRLLCLDLLLWHPEITIDGTATEHCWIVEFIDSFLCFYNCFVQNVSVFEAFLRVLLKPQRFYSADHAENFVELFFSYWSGDVVYENVWIVSLFHLSAYRLNLVLVALILQVLLPANMLGDYQNRPISGSLLVHLLNCVLCVFTPLKVDITLVSSLTINANLNFDWVDLTEWFKHLFQLCVCGALVQVLDEKIGVAWCSVLDSIAVLLLFVNSKLNLLTSDVCPI